VWSGDRHVVGDTGYAGRPQARHHNTVVVGGFGQGLEREHDTWEGMDRKELGGTRLESAQLGAGYARIVAEIAAAYAPEAGLRSFRRELSFEAPGRFRVHDRLETSEERSFEWLLHGDRPFVTTGTSFSSDLGGGLKLGGEVSMPREVRLRSGPTILTAPGQPGSIEQGRKNQRGFELVLETPAPSRSVEFDVSFEVTRAPTKATRD
jgi:Heparinase II/III-like protein